MDVLTYPGVAGNFLESPSNCVHSVCTDPIVSAPVCIWRGINERNSMQVKITKRSVDSLAVGEIIADTELKGFVARRLRSGAVTYGLRYRDRATGRQRWLGLGLHGTITADQARVLAKKRAGGCRQP